MKRPKSKILRVPLAEFEKIIANRVWVEIVVAGFVAKVVIKRDAETVLNESMLFRNFSEALDRARGWAALHRLATIFVVARE